MPCTEFHASYDRLHLHINAQISMRHVTSSPTLYNTYSIRITYLHVHVLSCLNTLAPAAGAACGYRQYKQVQASVRTCQCPNKDRYPHGSCDYHQHKQVLPSTQQNRIPAQPDHIGVHGSYTRGLVVCTQDDPNRTEKYSMDLEDLCPRHQAQQHRRATPRVGRGERVAQVCGRCPYLSVLINEATLVVTISRVMFSMGVGSR